MRKFIEVYNEKKLEYDIKHGMVGLNKYDYNKKVKSEGKKPKSKYI